MAYGPKGEEIGPIGSRIDCERRSGVGRYVRVSEGPNAPQRAKPAGCHTLPYVALCSTTLHVVHSISDIPPRLGLPPIRLIDTKTNFPLTLFPPGNKEPGHSDFLAQVLLPRFFPFNSRHLALTSPFQFFRPGSLARFFFVSRATYSLFDKCTALPYDTCMAPLFSGAWMVRKHGTWQRQTLGGGYSPSFN